MIDVQGRQHAHAMAARFNWQFFGHLNRKSTIPIGVAPGKRAPSRARTDTGRILSPLPLPIGL